MKIEARQMRKGNDVVVKNSFFGSIIFILLLAGQSAIAQTCPTAYAVGGGGAYCSGGTGVSITLANSQTGNTYQLRMGAISIGSPLSGTGSALTWPNITDAGTYTIIGTNTAISCNVTMTGSVNVTVNTRPTPTFTTGPATVCAATAGNVYTTQASMSNYVWVVSAGGTITAGGTSTSNTVTVTWNTAGAQTVSVNYNNASGCAAVSPTVQNVTVTARPTPTFTTGPATVCAATAGNVYTTQASMTNYVWVVSAGGTITAGGTTTSNTVTVTWNTAGAQTVSVNYTSNGCAAVSPTVQNVTVNARPTPTFTTGPATACVGSTGNVYTTQASMTNYVWVVSAGGTITAGGTTTSNTVTVTWATAGARTVSVNYTNASGCTAAAATVQNVTVNARPTPTFTTGPATACTASTGNVYTTQASMTNYVWVVSPGGTITAGGTTTSNTVTVTWNTAGAQTVSVNYTSNGCAAVSPTVQNVTVTARPTPTFTTGPASVCVGSTGNVYTTQASMTNYVWVVSAGGTITAGGTTTSNTVTVTWATAGARTVSVNYTSGGCAAVSPTVQNVTVNALPTPTFTTGPASVCAGATSNVYTTQPSMSNYVWVVSAGGTITAGGTTTSNTVTVTWNTAGAQSVSVNYTNASSCTAASPTVQAVTVNPIPVPTFTAGPTSAYTASTGNVYSTEASMTNYVWVVSAGGTITAGGTSTSNTVTVTWNTAGAQSVSIRYTSAAGCIAAAPVVRNVNVNTAGTFAVAWTDLQNMTVNGDNSLTRINGSGWNAGADSFNKLFPYQDGWIQFTIPNLTSVYMVGLSGFNSDVSYPSLNNALYLNNATGNVYENGSSVAGLPAFVVGSVFRISREGAFIKYYHNGVVFRTIAVAAAKPLRVDIAINVGSAPVVTASFDKQLEVKPTFTYPTLANNNGGINLTVDGGYAPVSYLWSSSETAPSITGKARGTFSVSINDAGPHLDTKSYSIGYPVGWVDKTNITVNSDNSLTKTVASGSWDSGASSSNLLPASTDGWMEFVVKQVGAVFMTGFSRSDFRVNYNDISYAFYFTSAGEISFFESGTNYGPIFYQAEGDIYRIARESNTIKYYINGVVVRTVANIVDPLMVDASILTGSIPQINSSFDQKIVVRPAYTYPNEFTNTGGGIVLNTDGGNSPYSYVWSSGETTSSISNKARGLYTVNITDAYGRTFSGSYNLGYMVSWTDVRNSTLNANNSLTKITPSAWDAGAISGNKLVASTDGWLEIVINELDGSYIIGLSRFNADISNANIDYGFYMVSGLLYVRELSANTNMGYMMKGDVYRIERIGALIKYYRNGIQIRSVAAVSNQLDVDFVSLVGPASSPVVATTSFGQGTPQTYYSIASGNWNVPATWSLTEGGAAATTFPMTNDIVYVKGYTVTISGTAIYSPAVNVIATNATTALKIDGANTGLTVKGEVKISGLANTDPSKALIVQNEGKITIQ